MGRACALRRNLADGGAACRAAPVVRPAECRRPADRTRRPGGAPRALPLHEGGDAHRTSIARHREFRPPAIGIAALALRFSRSIRAVGLCCLMLGACAESAGGGAQSYVVRPQDTLYSIAWRHDLDYRDLARWNNIGPDYRISIGQVLVLTPRRSSAG